MLIPNSVTTIRQETFSGCYSLTSVEIPNSVTTIGIEAFAGCGLTSVEFPNSITEIGDLAFWCCSGLISVVFPNSVKLISERAFEGCSRLKEITSLSTTPPGVIFMTFNGVPTSTCVLKVPAASVEAYKAADVWKDFKNIVGI